MKREFSSRVKLGSHQQDRMTAVALVLVFIGCILATDLRAQAYNDLVTYPGRPNYGALKFSSPQSWFNYLMLWQHQRDDQRSEELQQAFASKADMEKYIAAVRQKMRQLAGSFPERGDLHSRVVGTVEGDGFVVEKIIFESHPHHYVTAHLYLPVGSKSKKFPACVEMCGHGLQGKGNGSGTAVQMARNGIAVLVVDPIGQGEMQQLIDGTGRNLTRGVTTEHTLLAPAYNLLGTSLEAQIFWDNSRAVDYLCTRKDIDAKHIGWTGMAIGSIILLHAFRCTKHVVGLLHFLHTFEGTIMIDEIKKSIEHLERTRRHAQCHIGMVDAQGTFAWNPLAAVTGPLQFQGTSTITEEKANARRLNAVIEGKQI